jgi:hypothetical protein
MPGTPHHGLGGPGPTIAVATVVAGVCVVGLVLGLRSGLARRRLILGGGAGYAVVLLALWAVVRLLFYRFASDFSDPGSALGVGVVVTAVAVVLGLQWTAATVLFDTYQIRAAVAWLFLTAWVTAFAYLQVGGESGGVFLLLIWALAIGPVLLSSLAVFVAGELVARQLHRLA